VWDPRRVLAFAAPLFVYAVVAALLFGTGTSWTRQYFGGGDSDAFVFIWFLNWWPFAVAHHINPFVTAFQWFPRGDNVRCCSGLRGRAGA